MSSFSAFLENRCDRRMKIGLDPGNFSPSKTNYEKYMKRQEDKVNRCERIASK